MANFQPIPPSISECLELLPELLYQYVNFWPLAEEEVLHGNFKAGKPEDFEKPILNVLKVLLAGRSEDEIRTLLANWAELLNR